MKNNFQTSKGGSDGNFHVFHGGDFIPPFYGDNCSSTSYDNEINAKDLEEMQKEESGALKLIR